MTQLPLPNRFISDFTLSQVADYLSPLKPACLIIRMFLRSVEIIDHLNVYVDGVKEFLNLFDKSAETYKAKMKVLIFFHIQYETEDGMDPVAKAFVDNPYYECLALDRLEKVNDIDIKEWLYQHFKYDEQSQYEQRFKEIYDPVHKDQFGGVYMDELAVPLTNAIELYNRSKLT